MMNFLKKVTLATAAAGMMLLGPISIGDNSAKADRGWRDGRGWRGNGYYRRGIPGDGWRARSWSGYRGYRPYYGGYYRPYYGGAYYSPYRPFVPWTSVYPVPGYGYGVGVGVW